MSIQLRFDYESLDIETRIAVQEMTGEIKERLKRTASDIIEIGERLTDIKARLGHGRFGTWLKAEFEWSYPTANNLMNVAEAFNSLIIRDLSVAPTALYALAAPSVPEVARQEAIERASSGERIGTREAKEIIERHKPPENVFEREYRLDPELNFGPAPREPEAPPARPSTNGHAPAATQRPPEKSKAERYRDHFLQCIDDLDDLTRAVAAPEKHSGYGGLPAVLDMLGEREAIRVMGKAQTLIERLERWVLQIKEHFGE